MVASDTIHSRTCSTDDPDGPNPGSPLRRGRDHRSGASRQSQGWSGVATFVGLGARRERGQRRLGDDPRTLSRDDRARDREHLPRRRPSVGRCSKPRGTPDRNTAAPPIPSSSWLVASGHRKDAFDACEFIMDFLKTPRAVLEEGMHRERRAVGGSPRERRRGRRALEVTPFRVFALVLGDAGETRLPVAARLGRRCGSSGFRAAPDASTATPAGASAAGSPGPPSMPADSRAVTPSRGSTPSSPMMIRPAVTSPMNSMRAMAKSILTSRPSAVS